MSLDSQVVGVTLQDNKEVDDERNGGLESEEDSEGGGSDADVITESLQQFKSVDGLLLDAASPVLAHFVPLLRLADGSKDTEEGKYSDFPQLCLSVTVHFSLSLQTHIC